MKALRYNHRPIGSVNSLAKALEFPVNLLVDIANTTENFYIPNELIIKPDGNERQTYTIKEPLKEIQKKILQKIINRVDFPEYLQGAIKDSELPRDYIHDAELHLNCTIIYKEDISTFFSSIRSKTILRIWKNFFRFPDYVAEILTSLTTYKGYLPEGAPTSSAISNLVFWDQEPALVNELRKIGYIYTRYIDDVTISSKKKFEKKDIRKITTDIYRMFYKAGLRPNRRKRRVQANNSTMRIHNLNINSGRPTLSKARRNKIRAAVNELERLVDSGVQVDQIEKKIEQVNGRVVMLQRLHPKEATLLIERLKVIKNKALSNKK